MIFIFGGLLLVLCINVAPFSLQKDTIGDPEFSWTPRPEALIVLLDWLPQILVRNGALGAFTYGLFLVSCLILQFVAALALTDFQIQNLQFDLRWADKKTTATIFLIAVFALLLPPLVYFRDGMSFVSQQLLIPISSFGICVICGWMIPAKALGSLWGRGIFEDSLLRVFLWMLRYVIPLILIFGIIRSFYFSSH